MNNSKVIDKLEGLQSGLETCRGILSAAVFVLTDHFAATPSGVTDGGALDCLYAVNAMLTGANDTLEQHIKMLGKSEEIKPLQGKGEKRE